MRLATVALAILAATMVAPIARAGAQDAPPVVTPESVPSRWRPDRCIGGLTYGAPYKLALSLGGGFTRESMTNGNDVCLMAVGKVGLGAASASVGIGQSIGSFGGGASITGGLLRTFGGSLDATPRRTYVGGSVHVWPALALGGEIGYYVRLGDDPDAASFQQRVIVWSFGFGF